MAYDVLNCGDQLKSTRISQDVVFECLRDLARDPVAAGLRATLKETLLAVSNIDLGHEVRVRLLDAAAASTMRLREQVLAQRGAARV